METNIVSFPCITTHIVANQIAQLRVKQTAQTTIDVLTGMAFENTGNIETHVWSTKLLGWLPHCWHTQLTYLVYRNDGIGYDDSDKFLTYDAYFNGTLNMVYIPLGSTQPRRPYLAPVNASLSIGQMVLSSDSSVSRSKWDANDFFMSFTTFEPASCVGDVTCSPSFYTVSDSSYYYWSQVCVHLLTQEINS